MAATVVAVGFSIIAKALPEAWALSAVVVE
eukprot:COSAG05_NODE_14694_length_390_cov_0.704467_1_plen_29_part_10